jgi:Bacterial regulatory helix-turn-helix protein, lysR family/LysR substrate binding domain
MHLRHIEAMIALVQTGTVGRAAQRLRISQPAVSKILKNIEHETGLKLFERAMGKLSLTEEAMLLYDEMERVYDGIMRLGRFAEEIRTLRYGTLRIGVMPALSVGFIQDVVKGFLKDRPSIQVSVHSRSSQKVAERVIAGHLDGHAVVELLEGQRAPRQKDDRRQNGSDRRGQGHHVGGEPEGHRIAEPCRHPMPPGAGRVQEFRRPRGAAVGTPKPPAAIGPLQADHPRPLLDQAARAPAANASVVR